MKKLFMLLFFSFVLIFSSCGDDGGNDDLDDDLFNNDVDVVVFKEYEGFYVVNSLEQDESCLNSWSQVDKLSNFESDYFLLDSGLFFGFPYLGLHECETSDESSCDKSMSFNNMFNYIDGKVAEESSYSFYSGNICTLGFSEKIINKEGNSVEIVTTKYDLNIEGIDSDTCLDEDYRESKQSSATCSSKERILAEKIE
ncbi:hypothetical protein JXR93_05495 [bacterium]|nr:hypothetical protein [bacterium]